MPKGHEFALVESGMAKTAPATPSTPKTPSRPKAPPCTPPPSAGFVDRARAESATSSAAPPQPKTMLRSYMVWPARNTFCCWGHLMTGPPEDLMPNMCAWVTIVVPMTLFLYSWATTLYDASLPLLAFVRACVNTESDRVPQPCRTDVGVRLLASCVL